MKVEIAPNATKKTTEVKRRKIDNQIEELAVQGKAAFGSTGIITARQWLDFVIAKTGLGESSAGNRTKEMRDQNLIHWNEGRGDKSFYSFDEACLNSNGTVSADMIFEDVQEEVKNEVFDEKKYPEELTHEDNIWASVFPTEGKKIYKANEGNPEPVNFLELLGGESTTQTQLESALRIAATKSGITETGEELQDMVEDTVERIIENFESVDIFYISKTDITRYQVGAGKAGTLIRNNPEYKGGFASLYLKKAADYASEIEGSLESKLTGQVHHLVPLYLGGSHYYKNLLEAYGDARINVEKYPEKAAESAHKALHDLIENKEDVEVRILGEMKDGTKDANITLDTLSPGKVKSAIEKQVNSLDLIIGTMYGDGFVKYVNSSIDLAKIRKEKSNTQV